MSDDTAYSEPQAPSHWRDRLLGLLIVVWAVLSLWGVLERNQRRAETRELLDTLNRQIAAAELELAIARQPPSTCRYEGAMWVCRPVAEPSP